MSFLLPVFAAIGGAASSIGAGLSAVGGAVAGSSAATAGLIGAGGALAANMLMGGGQKAPDMPSAQTPSDIGNLTEEEAKKSASSKAYRIGAYFSSPTGVLNSSPRRGSKLLAA